MSKYYLIINIFFIFFNLYFGIYHIMELFKILIETNEISSNKCFSVSLNLGAVLLLAIVLAK